ncbi:MAG: 5' nucleotidase, NT5C type [Spirochaetota bacterium]
MNRLKICCDVDGVILDFGSAYKKWLEENHPKIKINPYDYHCGVPYELGKDFVTEFWKTGIVRRLKPFPGAREYFNKLAQYYDMYIVTALKGNYKEQRKESLKGFDYKELYIIEHKKAEWIIKELKPDIAIEDKPGNIMTLSEVNIKVYYPSFILYTMGLKDYGVPFDSWRHLWELLKPK